MPSRYVIRTFSENSYYHVFNRGVEKRNIFEDEQDYNIFKYYLSIYLLPKEIIAQKFDKVPFRLLNKNLNDQLELLAYCLMPNHFHLLLKQLTIDAISRFMKQLTNAYTLYFNNKYDRVGGLMQGRFKAVLIDSDEQLLHVSRYIHLNPITAQLTSKLGNYFWSSYPSYTNGKNDPLVKKGTILDQFNSSKDYRRFVSDQEDYAKKLDKSKHLFIEQDI